MKRSQNILYIGLLGIVIAYSWSFFGKPVDAIDTYQRSLPAYLEQKFEFAENILRDPSFLNYFLQRNELRYLNEIERTVNQLKSLEEKEIGVFILQNQKPLLTSSIVNWPSLDSVSQSDEKEFFQWQDEKVWLSRTFDFKENIEAIVFIPLHLAPGADRLLFFQEAPLDAKSITVGAASRIEVLNKFKVQSPWWQFLILVISGLLLWRYGHRRYRIFLQENQFLRGILTVLITATVLIFWLQTNIWEGTYWWSRPLLNSTLLPSTLWGLGTQLLVTLWLFSTFYQLFSGVQFLEARPGSMVYMIMANLVSLGMLAGVAYWLKQVMSNEIIFFNYEQALQISRPALVVAFSLVFWLMAVFLFAKRMLEILQSWSTNLNQRILCIVIAIFLSYVIVLPLDLGISLLAWSLLGFVFLMLIDLQLDSGSFNLTWVMVWMILLSAFSASFTQRYGSEAVLSAYFEPLNLFGLYFSLFLLVILLFLLLDRWLKVFPDFLVPVFKTSHSFRNRIQLAVIGIILLSSVVIGSVTIWFFRTSEIETQEKGVLESMQNLEGSLSEIPLSQMTDWSVQRNEIDPPFVVYNSNGALLFNRDTVNQTSSWMPASVLEALRVALYPHYFQKNKAEDHRVAYMPIQTADGNIKAYIGMPYAQFSGTRAQEINNIVGSIFSLYVFFMFVAGGIAIWVANSITEPISKIGEGLRNLRLGGNTPLSWKNQDEIGLLIQEYNSALAKLEQSTRQLRKAEREGAWRDMAQQVAHEIKNPLTPMKLSVQHLLRAYQSNPDEIGPLLKRMSRTLIEQIEGLTKIANEFSNFAQMPEANIEKIDLNSLLASVVDLFDHQEGEVSLQLNIPSEDLLVSADKDQLIRVLNNLLTNAAQAIPDDRSGKIEVKAEQLQNLIKIAVRDNGTGIPAELQEKVFYPYFTAKSSGIGIGLSMCRNIIEQFGGRIYFNTQVGEGTTFYLELEAAE